MSLPSPVFDGVIDVSDNNSPIVGKTRQPIDWKAVAGAGIGLAFAKSSQGATEADPCFAANVAGAAANGVLTIAYHFIAAGVAPALQAQHFIQAAGLTKGSPAMLDWETKVPAAWLVAIGQAVAAVTGRDPVCYYGGGILKAADPVLSRWPLMLPEYPRGNTTGTYASLVRHAPPLPPGRPAARPYDFHQYSPAGHIAGIAGPVDRSIWVGTLDTLKAWHATGALPA